VLEKWFTFIVVITTVLVLMGVGMGVMIILIGQHMPFGQQFELLFMCWLLSVCVGTITVMAGAIRGTRGMAALVGTVVAFGGYLVTSFAAQVSWLRNIDYVSLFHYYHPNLIVKQGMVWSHVVLYIVVTVTALIIAVIGFNNRDVSV
jgi:ABC-type transport system involved in multi-copper enzyme maturation permease subunit